ncbi:hypothetical protein [Streptomyces sp. ISL-44]|uniref:hypothetical protein n=1 Tax=Streptomyces sp. ISL-44 TaxID=2819184 RepID=UPI002036291E|nr:hypothetical protein [Streptomyces sp. ISL-44]
MYEGRVENVTAPPRRRELDAGPRVSGAGRGQVLADLPGGVRAQRYRPADRTQPTAVVQAAEDKKCR